MEIRGFDEEERFCHVMKDWWEAEDMRGLSAATRYHRRMVMRDWLMDFSTYYPIGMFTTGIPTSTFQSFLKNYERSIQLYPYVKTGKYNSRSKGTLENATLFGEFHKVDPKNIGYLHPKNVPKIMSAAMQLALMRLTPKR